MSDDSEERVVIRVSPDVAKYIKKYAEEKELTMADAADALIRTAKSRRNALKRYSDSQKPPPR